MGITVCCNHDQGEVYNHDKNRRLKLSKSKVDSRISNTYEEALVFSEVIMTGKPQIEVD